MLAGLLTISSRCEKAYWEMDNYIKDKNGKIPKINDHLIDDFRYILGAEAYQLKDEEEYREENDPDFRGARISDDFPGLSDSLEATEEWDQWN
jgi:hypothetical protein